MTKIKVQDMGFVEVKCVVWDDDANQYQPDFSADIIESSKYEQDYEDQAIVMTLEQLDDALDYLRVCAEDGDFELFIHYNMVK